MAAVDHNRRETAVDTALADLEAVAVIEVKYDLGVLPAKFLGVFHCSLSHVAEKGCVGIVAGTL